MYRLNWVFGVLGEETHSEQVGISKVTPDGQSQYCIFTESYTFINPLQGISPKQVLASEEVN